MWQLCAEVMSWLDLNSKEILDFLILILKVRLQKTLRDKNWKMPCIITQPFNLTSILMEFQNKKVKDLLQVQVKVSKVAHKKSRSQGPKKIFNVIQLFHSTRLFIYSFVKLLPVQTFS